MSHAVIGRTAYGQIRLHAESKTQPGLRHDVLISRDGARVSCDCAACTFHPDALNGRLTVSRKAVLSGQVKRCCWHIRNAARLAPLAVRGYVLRNEGRA